MRLQRSIQALLSNVAFSTISTLLAIFTTPLIVSWLGEARFGAYRACLDWFGYVSLLEFGIGGALLPLFVQSVASGIRERQVHVVRAGFRAYRSASILMLVATVLVTLGLPR